MCLKFVIASSVNNYTLTGPVKNELLNSCHVCICVRFCHQHQSERIPSAVSWFEKWLWVTQSVVWALWEYVRECNTSWAIDIDAITVICFCGRWQENVSTVQNDRWRSKSDPISKWFMFACMFVSCWRFHITDGSGYTCKALCCVEYSMD
jgi:hypothetical protein